VTEHIIPTAILVIAVVEIGARSSSYSELSQQSRCDVIALALTSVCLSAIPGYVFADDLQVIFLNKTKTQTFCFDPPSQLSARNDYI
jgi:hypothetical protein